MNRIAEATWPAALGGGAVAKPRGVVVLGDCIDDGDKVVKGKNVSAEQYASFVADFGLDGTDGRLKFPVFEGWGNHDGPPVGKEKNGFSFQAHLKDRNRSRLSAGRISNLSPETGCTIPGTGTTCTWSTSTSIRPTARARASATPPSGTTRRTPWRSSRRTWRRRWARAAGRSS